LTSHKTRAQLNKKPTELLGTAAMNFHASRAGLRVLMGALTAGVLASCAFVDSVSPRYDSVNRATEKARNDSILLNLIRAAHSAPLNFIVFSKVSGSTTAGGSAGLPGFAEGPKPVISTLQREFVFGSSTLSGSSSANNSFDISILESRDFYLALLRPVDLATLNFFIRQGYSRQLLYWLFVDSVEETIQGKTFGYRFDPAIRDRGCAQPFGQQTKCVQDLIDIAFITGLTVETKVIDKGAGGGGASKGKGGGGGGANAIYSRFCFDRVLSERALKEIPPEETKRLRALIWSTQHLPACRFNWDPAGKAAKDGSAETDTLEFNQPNTPRGTIHYRIVPRSIFGIYKFLGSLLAEGIDSSFMTANARDGHLLTVTKGASGDCFDVIYYSDGEYCVPESATNTKQIVQILAQLIALQTQTSDLAITPTVRVTP
jgi:hypothetical protein